MDTKEVSGITAGQQAAWKSPAQCQPIMHAIARVNCLNDALERDRQIAAAGSRLPFGQCRREGMKHRINNEARRSAISEAVEVPAEFYHGDVR